MKLTRQPIVVASAIAIAIASAVLLPGPRGPQLAAADLTIGTKAPNLDIEFWMNAEKPDFKPVKTFEEGKVYVVEFWATWCPPCRASMPHLAKLQTEYPDDVRIISISDESLETVVGFLDGEVPEKPDTTYAKLTSVYDLTTDPDGSAQNDYMRAANQSGIPSAFIVGKSGQVEWIGHPMEMDAPLSAVVKDSWDRAAFAKKFEAAQQLPRIIAKLQKAIGQSDIKEVESIIKQLETDFPDNPQVAQMLPRLKLELLFVVGDITKIETRLSELAKADPVDAATIDQISWNLYLANKKDGEKFPVAALAKSAEACATALKTVENERQFISLSDTLAHTYEAMGKLDEAIASQEAAVEKATGRLKSELEKYLASLKKAKAGPKEAGSSEGEPTEGDDK